MATAVFTGAGGSSWTAVANWSGGSGAGGIPGNNDTIVVNTSSQDLSSNLTTGLTGCTLFRGPGYTGTIGNSTTFLSIAGPLAQIDARGGGSTYMTGTWTDVVCDGGSGANMLQLRANASTDIGTLRVLGGSGTVTVGGNAVLDDLLISGADSVSVVIAANVTSLDTIDQSSGLLTCSANVGTSLSVRAGGVAELAGSATCLLMNVYGRGTARYTSSGRITTLHTWGIFDGRDNANPTVTAPAAIYGYDGGRLLLRNGLETYVGWAVTMRGVAIVEAPIGSTLTVS